MCVHTRPAGPRTLYPLPLTAHRTGSPGKSAPYPILPLVPALASSAVTRLSLRLQTYPARVCLLCPSRSLGLKVELPEGMAFTAARGGFSRSWPEAPPQ